MVYTVEDVVKEIRDVKTRESLNVMLYTLKFKEPSTDAIRFGKIGGFFLGEMLWWFLVTNYAKKTGDYAALSAVDLRLLALTYQLYQENVGTENLNLEPKINVSCVKEECMICGWKFRPIYQVQRHHLEMLELN